MNVRSKNDRLPDEANRPEDGAVAEKRRKNAVKLAAFLIAALFLAIVVLGAIGLSGGSAVFPSEITVSEKPIRYSASLTERYYKAMRLFFLTENAENPMFEWLFDGVYNAFSTARIPSEKVIWFVERVETVQAEENPAYLWIFEKNERFEALMKEYEDGLREEEPTYHDVISIEEMKIGFTAVFGFLAESPLTNDELGRLIYRTAVLYAGDPHYTALLETVGEEDIAMLTVGTYRVYKTSEAFVSATSVSAARSIGQSLVALGSSYLSLIKKVGLDAVDTLFGLDYRLEEGREDSFISKETIPYYNRQLDELEGFAGGFLLLTGEILSCVSDSLFEELYYANASEKEGKTEEAELHRWLAACELSKSVRAGLDRAKSKSENRFVTDREAVEMLSNAYVASFRMNDIFDENLDRLNDDARYAAYKNEAEFKLAATIQTVETLKRVTAEQTATQVFAALIEDFSADAEMRNKMKAETDSVFGYDITDPEAITDLLFGLAVNAFVRLFGN